MSRFGVWWADSRGKIVAVLLLLWFGSVIVQFELIRVIFPVLSVVMTYVCDLGVSFLRKRQPVATLSSAVTGLLIGLIFDPTAGGLSLVAACALAVITKQFFGVGDHRHILNPAAAGIMSASLLFSRPVAWWGATWGIGPIIIIAIAMTPVLHKLRRLWMPVSFLLIYFLSNALVVSAPSALRLTIDGTVFLFAFIMIPEPITSISGSVWRYAWGALVGGLVIAQSVLHLSVGDPLLLALLAANVIGFLFVRFPFIRRSSVQTA